MKISSFHCGIDQLLSAPALLDQLRRQRVGMVAHPASVTAAGQHALDALIGRGVQVVRAFGPQHGLRGDKQDNMVESPDFIDPVHGIPVTSLYGRYRYPQPEMLRDLDVVLFDLQDIGCRVYTFITTLRYFIEACSRQATELWILDRPNPAGRPVDGLRLQAGHESFVGSDSLPMRHGMTVGELSGWFANRIGCERPRVITMPAYTLDRAPGFGWPLMERPWINPSPNAPRLNMARCFSGTVLLEGTTLSEGRGTTTPLEVIGAPDFPVEQIREALPSSVTDGVWLRNTWFLPTFHKYEGQLCQGLQIHTDLPGYDHARFRPFRLVSAMLKALRGLRPEYELWRHHEYEYEQGRTPIDVINGGPWLREWVDDPDATLASLDHELNLVERQWRSERASFLLY
ncbi:MAG: DUF1343 domain-containing protein [Proteobacteria bacterium]|nr:DUF1343 domain-containing protein [Pseudomonadota bacterium]MDA1301469.1 DUF1343 domain-containing protein [Pseudomonadota bacterium]